MHTPPSAAIIVLCLLVAASGGCAGSAPNSIAVSPDGKTLYLSLNADGGLPVDESSVIYSLDVEKGRLTALSGDTSSWGGFSVSEDGKTLLCGEGMFFVSAAAMNLADRKMVPFSGLAHPMFLARFVPGPKDGGRMLAVEAELMKGENRAIPRWVMLQHERPVRLLPDDYMVAGLPSAACRTRIVLPAAQVPNFKTLKDEELAQVKAELYLVDVSGDEPGKPVRILTGLHIDLLSKVQPLISRDGARIAVSLPPAVVPTRPDAARDPGKVVEVDPVRPDAQRVLFEADVDGPIEFTPDAKGVVWSAREDGMIEIRLWEEAIGKQRVLARYPAEEESATPPTFRWMEDHRLQIVAATKEGLRIIETNLDGTKAEAKQLARKSLRVQRRLADIAWTIEHGQALAGRKRPDPPGMGEPVLLGKDGKPQHVERKVAPEVKQELADVEATLAPVCEMMKARDAEITKQLEAEWAKVDGWEKVPVLAESPKREPAPEKAK